jgi:hypothetical protein
MTVCENYVNFGYKYLVYFSLFKFVGKATGYGLDGPGLESR